MKTFIFAAALALAAGSNVSPAAAEGIPTGSRVLKLCWIEDPDCVRLVRESYERVESQSRCPAGSWIPPDVAVRAWASAGPSMIRIAPDQPIDWSVGSAISIIDASWCVPR